MKRVDQDEANGGSRRKLGDDLPPASIKKNERPSKNA